MRIRRLHPHIESKTKKKKHKPYKEYKENKVMASKVSNARKKPMKYHELSENQREAIRNNSIKHSLRATKGETPKMRMIRRRRRKEYLRIKYKLQNRTKVCTICKVNRALSDFDYQRDRKHKKKYRRTYCFLCRKKMNAEAYQRRKHANTTTIH